MLQPAWCNTVIPVQIYGQTMESLNIAMVEHQQAIRISTDKIRIPQLKLSGSKSSPRLYSCGRVRILLTFSGGKS